MTFLRKTALWGAHTLLVSALLSFLLLFSLLQVLGTPHAIKNAARQSELYSSIVTDALKEAQKKQPAQLSDTGGEEIPLSNPEVQRILNQALPPSYIQSQTEQIVDAAYAWLQGVTPTLSFTINVAEAKARLADGLGSYAQQHLASLPVCTAATMPQGEVDIFNATCVPPGFDISAAAAQARQQILDGEFIKDTTITAADIKNNEGKTLDQQLQAAPRAYDNVRGGIYILGIVAVLLSVAVIFLCSHWRRGLHALSIVYISVGAISTVLAWLSHFSIQKVAAHLIKAAEAGALQQKMADMIQLLAGDLRNWWIGLSLGLVGLGISGLLALRLTRPPEKTLAGKVNESVESEAMDNKPSETEKPSDDKSIRN
ncbi:MAG TPA: hypothetical protein VJ836_07045 [Candidatus Saccharimonadales bacterium]|nr:hypothetical protein [Candidatus Saccharimonadales bacterium]